MLPALLGILERRGFELPQRGRQDLNTLHLTIQPWNGMLLTMAGILTVLAIAGARYVTFDIHLLKMQNPNLESVRTEMMLVSSGKSSVLTAFGPGQRPWPSPRV